MSLDKILSISGMPGLYKLISQNKAGFVVESLADHKRTMVNAQQRISMIKDISMYTRTDDRPLREIMLAIREKYGDRLPVHSKSSPEELKKFFEEAVPDYDRERVYVSDIKKVVSWYPLVRDHLDNPEDNAEKKTD